MTGRRAAEIAASVEDGIRTGELAPGALLPPVRVLADRLGMSAATVAKAYQTLRSRGVVETAGRNGTRVRSRPSVATTRQARRLSVPPGVRDLSAGEPDPALLSDLSGPLARVAAQTRAPVTYADGGALPELLDLAAQELAADGVPVNALTVTNGTLDGVERVLGTRLLTGDRVGVEDPGWANMLDLVACLGAELVPIPTDDDGPTPQGMRAALRAGVRAVLVTARAQNPTGAAITAERAAALRRELAPHPDVLVVEDDHSGALVAEPLASLAGATRSWAFLRSVSKTYGPDLRLAVLAGDERTVARAEGRMQLGAGWVSTIIQRLAIEVWRDPDERARVARAGRTYDERRQALRAALLSRGVPARGRTGLNVWVSVPDETMAVARLRDDGYAVAPGALFRVDSPPAIRITVGSLNPADLTRLADAVARAVSVAGPGRRSG